MLSHLATVEEALEDIKQGKMVILIDDQDRENEGDLVIAAQFISPETINFMSTHGKGLICLSMTEQLIDKLGLQMMASKNQSRYQTAFTQSIEAAHGVTTGISAHDRAHTIKVAIDPQSGPAEIISPGHVFPLKARAGGVLEREGQTEGSVDLCKLANLTHAAVICEIINDDGSMSRTNDLIKFGLKHDLKIVSVNQIIEHRVKHQTLVEVVAQTNLPIDEFGEFEMQVFSNQLDEFEHFALIKKPQEANQVPLVRIHSECITGDVFSSRKCDCGSQLNLSLQQISEQGGILIYLRQEGRGIGLSNKIKAYSLQEEGYDTVEANLALGLPVDNRDYGIAYQILKYLGIDYLRLLTNNPDKIEKLADYGLKVLERVPLVISPSKDNMKYLYTKQNKLGHLLS